MVQRATTSLPVVRTWRHDPVFVTTVAAAVLAWLAALGLILVKRPFLLHKLAIPFALWFYHPVHVPTVEDVEELQRFLSALAAGSAVIGGMALGYGYIWHYLLRRLLPAAPSMHVSPARPVCTLEWCCLAAVFVLAVILRLYHINRGLTLDELTTAIKFVDVHSLWTTLSTDDGFNNHLANSLLAWVFQRILGRSEWVLRLPAFLLGLSSLYVLWTFTRRYSGSILALLATAGLAFSPAHVFWSVTARGYVGMLLFTLLSTSLYFQILESPAWRKGLLYILSSVLAIFFHLFGAFVVLTQFAFLLYLAVREIASEHSGRILSVGSYRTLYLAFPVIVGMSFACYVLILPQYFFNLREAKHGAFNLLFPFEVLGLFSYGPVRSVDMGWWILTGIMGSLCIIGWIAFRHACARIANYLGCLAILPLLIVMPARPYYLSARFFLFWLPFYVIMVGKGMLAAWHLVRTRSARISRFVFQGCYLMVVGVMLSTWVVRVWFDYPRLEHGFREAAWEMERNATPTTGLCAIGWASWRLQYYLHRDLLIPRDWEDFAQFTHRYPAITCADASFEESGREPAYIRDIGAFLVSHARSQQYHGIVVYSYEKTS